MNRPVVALLSDFGTRDWYVAAMKGVILSRVPEVQLLDITHEIPPQDVVAGAFTLAAVVRWLPPGTVVAAVVDPGVGTSRALLAARVDGRFVVGPDNGLLALALRDAKRRMVVRLANRSLWLPDVSRTFHGRDIIAPVAAYLARGGALGRLGPRGLRLTPLALPPVRRRRGFVEGAIVHIDGFGNLVTNLPATLAATGSRLRCRGRAVPVVSSYADAAPGALIAVAGSLGWLEVAVRNGSAARRLRARRGQRVAVETPHG
jgi:hypothetical protein